MLANRSRGQRMRPPRKVSLRLQVLSFRVGLELFLNDCLLPRVLVDVLIEVHADGSYI